MTRHAGLSLLVVAASVGVHLGAQGPNDPRFEVASVKPNVANDGRVSISGRGGRYSATGASLKLLIRTAYQLQEFQVVGGPDWLEADRFDVVATAPDGVGPATAPDGPTQQQLMLRSLLKDRFNLVVHHETREMPVYALILAQRVGKIGPALKAVSADCTGGNNPSTRNTPPAATGQRQLGPCSTSVGPGFVLAHGRTLAQFAAALSTLGNTGMSLNRMIIDRTGLQGSYDVDLHFTPDRIPNFGPDGPPPGVSPIDPNGPSIFTAVQEQLGLKLDAQRGPVDVLVIDRAERPTAD
jgi:uncharacterized protein (TIGR03435 family)